MSICWAIETNLTVGCMYVYDFLKSVCCMCVMFYNVVHHVDCALASKEHGTCSRFCNDSMYLAKNVEKQLKWLYFQLFFSLILLGFCKSLLKK